MTLPNLRDCTCLCIIFTFLQISAANAEQWIDAGDERTRHHLQALSDAGHLNLPLTSWPLMWTGVSRELSGVEPAELSDAALNSYHYLKRKLEQSQRALTAGAGAAATSRPGLIDYAMDTREQSEAYGYVTYASERWGGKLQASVVGDPISGQAVQLDGSYLAGTLGNWAVGAGAIERWWGPGWQSSLILSSAARPAPGLFINRVDNKAFDLPVLSWLGPWDLRVFLNQLEGDRSTPHAKLFGMRLNVRPLQSLEIGLTRVSQWGGGDRPEDLDTFWNMLIGKDNRGGEGIDADGSNEPGNQLAGIDWRLGHAVAGVPTAFYGQLIGEDEAGGLPYKWIGLAGVETSFLWGDTHSRLTLEVSNTTMEFNKGGTPNVAYEHPLYTSGYRYHGRPLGASTDNDSELYVVKGFHYLNNDSSFSWTLGTGNINSDGRNRAAPGGNVFSEERVDLWYATAQYTFPLSQNSELTFGGQYYDKELWLRNEEIETGVFAAYETRL